MTLSTYGIPLEELGMQQKEAEMTEQKVVPVDTDRRIAALTKEQK